MKTTATLKSVQFTETFSTQYGSGNHFTTYRAVTNLAANAFIVAWESGKVCAMVSGYNNGKSQEFTTVEAAKAYIVEGLTFLANQILNELNVEVNTAELTYRQDGDPNRISSLQRFEAETNLATAGFMYSPEKGKVVKGFFDRTDFPAVVGLTVEEAKRVVNSAIAAKINNALAQQEPKELEVGEETYTVVAEASFTSGERLLVAEDNEIIFSDELEAVYTENPEAQPEIWHYNNQNEPCEIEDRNYSYSYLVVRK